VQYIVAEPLQRRVVVAKCCQNALLGSFFSIRKMQGSEA
jgi:hypothetical protein